MKATFALLANPEVHNFTRNCQLTESIKPFEITMAELQTVPVFFCDGSEWDYFCYKILPLNGSK